MTNSTKAVLVTALAALWPLACAHAQSGEATALHQEVEQLKARLLEVESQLKNLQSREQQNAAGADQRQPSAAASAALPSRPYPEGWFQVAEGMTQAQIKSLIGPAHKSFELSGSEVWYYSYPGRGAGSVFFDSTGHASGYQRPSVWRLW